MATTPSTAYRSTTTHNNQPFTTTSAASTGRIRGVLRRRSIPHLLIGISLVVVSATAMLLITLNSTAKQQVLALAAPVTAGQVVTAGDLREVTISADSTLPAIAATEAPMVIGRSMAVSVPAGTLLAPSMVGTALVPVGQAILALAIKPGQLPPAAAAGSQVLIVPTAGTPNETPASGTLSAGSGWRGTVTEINTSSADQTTVVSLQLANGDAQRVAAMPPNRLVLLLISGGDH